MERKTTHGDETMTNPFKANLRITIQNSSGQTEKILVAADVIDGEVQPGPCYTREEWNSETAADWEYSAEDGLTFQGRVSPYNNSEVSFGVIW